MTLFHRDATMQIHCRAALNPVSFRFLWRFSVSKHCSFGVGIGIGIEFNCDGMAWSLIGMFPTPIPIPTPTPRVRVIRESVWRPQIKLVAQDTFDYNPVFG